MSWSIGFVGKAHAVAAKVREAASKFLCNEPEESVRQQALDTIAKVCESMPEASAVQVTGSGSMSMGYAGDGKSIVQSQNVNINVQPLYGFVE